MTRPTFRYPFDGMYGVSSPYGPRGDSFHTGTDFAVPSGVPILASNDGDVIYAAYEAGGAGNTITISGADGWQSRYHHLHDWVVWVGQHVAQGQLVGYCDSTGASSGPHLHFEIRPTPSTTTDPVPILEADAGAQPEPPRVDDTTDTEDTLLIVDLQRGKQALLFGNIAPRLLDSVNDYQRGAFVVLDPEAFDAAFAQQLAVYQATIA